jgi:Putative inner membrane exporter, YdcZ
LTAWRVMPSNLGDDPQKIDRLMLNVLLPSVLAVLAGASVALQQVLNANLRIALNSAAWSGFVSYFAGVACMAVLAFALREPVPSVAVAGRVPWWAYSGGLFGATLHRPCHLPYPTAWGCDLHCPACHRPDACVTDIRPFRVAGPHPTFD